MTDKEPIAGIDLGTTNSAIGILENGIPRLIEIDGRPTMPSCVGLDETGRILVGQAALNQLAAAPDRTVASIKRQMGSELPVRLGERDYRPEEISAFILKRLRQEAERDLGRPLTKAVVTVPAYFDEKQRRATRDAAQLAGFETVRILNEPTAAALAYNMQEQGSQTILVYDLGGGTFDVSLVACEKGLVEVKASHGDTQLGGDDFDEALVNHLVEAWAGAKPLDLSDPRTARRLKMAAEVAKCRLSDQPYAQVREEYMDPDTHLELEIDRNSFEELVAPLLEKTWDAMHAALRDGGTLPRNIDKIVLAGGSTRIPLVRHMIEARLGLAPGAELNPDLVVALGAAIQGGIIAGEEVGAILVDIATHTFSTSSIRPDGYGLFCVPIIPRGTPLPVTRAEAFRTIHDNQREVQVEVYQGESSEPGENLRIGEFLISGLGRVPAGNIITTQFSLDLDGLLEITAIEKDTGLAKAVTIDTHDVKATFDLAEARRRISSAFGDEPADAPPAGDEPSTRVHDETTRAKDLRKRAEKLMDGDLDEEDRADLQGLLDAMRDAVRARDFATLGERSDQIEDIIFYLED
jgi:molecular chaperone DnaK